MMISRLFRRPKHPGRIPVTDASVSPTKDGMGILIRKVVRKRPRPVISSSSSNSDDDTNSEAKEEDVLSTVGEENTDCGDTDDKIGANNENDVRAAETTKPPKGHATNEADDETEPNKFRFYSPKPGDLCVIRYDCYRLSPLELDLDRHGRQQISQAQKLQFRQKFWVDGNFETRPRYTNNSDGDADADNNKNDSNVTGSPYNSYVDNPYLDGSKVPLGLPGLEFEVGSGDVLRGLEVVVQRMVEGEVVEATIPHLYAYGTQGLYPRVPPNSDLWCVVKLVNVTPSAANAAAFLAHRTNGNSQVSARWATMTRLRRDMFVVFCNLAEAGFMVVFGIAIPILLLLSSEFDIAEMVRDLVTWDL